MIFKLAKEEYIYTRSYLNPETELMEKMTLIPTGEDSGDPDLINVKDVEQGFTYNVYKDLLNKDYKLELQSSADTFTDVKEEVSNSTETSGYLNSINKILRAPQKNDADLLEISEQGISELREEFSDQEIKDYFTIYKLLLKKDISMFDVAKANKKRQELKKPEDLLYKQMKIVASSVVKEYRDKKKRDILSNIADVPLSIEPNEYYDKIYSKYIDLKDKFKTDRETLVQEIVRIQQKKGVEESTNFSLSKFNKYIKHSFYTFIEKIYLKNKDKRDIEKEEFISVIINKMKRENLKYSEECDSFDINDFNSYISKETKRILEKRESIAESLLSMEEKSYSSPDESDGDQDTPQEEYSPDKKKVFNLIKDKAVELNPDLSKYKKMVSIRGFESALSEDVDDNKKYVLYLRDVIDIIKLVNPQLTVYRLIDFFACVYGNFELKKAFRAEPILKMAIGIEIIRQGII